MRRGLILGRRIDDVGARHRRDDLVEVVRAERAHIPKRCFCQTGFCFDIESGEGHIESVAVPANDVERHLGGRRWRLADHPADPDSISTDGPEFDGIEASGDIGAEVASPADFVEQLRGHRPDRHLAPGAVVFADNRASVL